jgi:hypothetical protein
MGDQAEQVRFALPATITHMSFVAGVRQPEIATIINSNCYSNTTSYNYL